MDKLAIFYLTNMQNSNHIFYVIENICMGKVFIYLTRDKLIVQVRLGTQIFIS